MSDIVVGHLAYQAPPAMSPLVGDSGGGLGIDAVTYPLGTPLSTSRVVGRRFNLYGVKPSDADNGAIVYIGNSAADASVRPQPLEPGKDEYITLEAPDNSFINLEDYYVTGADGDNVRWMRIA